MLRWNKLVVAGSVEAGKTWPHLPRHWAAHRKGPGPAVAAAFVGCYVASRCSAKSALNSPRQRHETNRCASKVKPGQGFARVRIDSVTPGVLQPGSTDTMRNATTETTATSLLPVSVVPDEEMSPKHGRCLRRMACPRQNTRDAIELLDRAYNDYLNKWPLAHNVDEGVGAHRARTFRLHYGTLDRTEYLDALPDPGIVLSFAMPSGRNQCACATGGAHGVWARPCCGQVAGFTSRCQRMFHYLRGFTTAHRTSSAPHPPRPYGRGTPCIGLAFETPDDLRRFYPLVVEHCRLLYCPNECFGAVRNIWQVRNHALHPDAISNPTFTSSTERDFRNLQGRVTQRKFRRGRFSEC